MDAMHNNGWQAQAKRGNDYRSGGSPLGHRRPPREEGELVKTWRGGGRLVRRTAEHT